ncbi:MAG: class I SAM-dependent methyltransferase [Polyangiaceae bacterium]
MPTKEFFVTAYEGAAPPWDLGRPQKDLVQIFDELSIAGSALDLGCGTGENVLELARRGLDAWGIDSTPAAIASAKAKREARKLDATFILGDALDLASLGRAFDNVLDCGLFHVISEEDRARYLKELPAILAPGGRFIMLGFQMAARERGPRGYTHAELRAYLAGYREAVFRPATYETNDSAEGVPAWLSVFERV